MNKTIGELSERSCSDPGYGGCIPRCDACRAREVTSLDLKGLDLVLAKDGRNELLRTARVLDIGTDSNTLDELIKMVCTRAVELLYDNRLLEQKKRLLEHR